MIRFARASFWLLGLSLFLPAGSPAQIGQPAATPATVKKADDFTGKVTIAGVSAVLSLITGYILFQLKERREPRKRLSYDLEMRRGLLGVDESIAKNVEVAYKGNPGTNLAYIRCGTKNAGNTVIKDQFLRFDFGEGARVLDSYMDPTPPREYGVLDVTESKSQVHERRFKIGHLEKQQKVTFCFVVSGETSQEVAVVPFNAEGDVEVVAGAVSRVADDRRRLEQFILLFILLSVLPPLFRWLPSFLVDTATSLLYAILTVAMIPLLRPVSRAVSAAVFALGRTPEPGLSIRSVQQNDGSSLQIVTGGVVDIHTSVPEEGRPIG